jgi:hemolysin III
MAAQPGIDYSFVTDGGPIYHETLPGRLIIEPWNAYSSLVFLIPVIYFLIVLRGQYRKQGFVVFYTLPLLFTGGIGSTLYHAFRSHHWLMMLDVFPMFLLSLGVAFFFMQRLFNNWYYPVLIIAASGFLRGYFFNVLPIQQAINISYFIVGVVIFIPALLYAWRSKWHAIGHLLAAVFFLALSLFFRLYDDKEVQPMAQGVHWLWHSFSAVGALFAGLYIIRTNLKNAVKPKPE